MKSGRRVLRFAVNGLLLTAVLLSGCAVKIKLNTPELATTSTATTTSTAASSNLTVALASTNPSSPSNASTAPSILVTSGSDVALVRVYSDASCSTLLASGATADAASPGLSIAVTSNTVTTLYAKGFSTGLLTSSSCTLIGSYEHDSNAPSGPGFVSTTPSSPINSTTSITVVGTAPADAAMVYLYSDVGCTSLVQSGTAATFTGAGLGFTITANNTTGIYAITTDAAINTSACTLLANIVHDNIGPTDPGFTSTSPSSPSASDTSPEVIGTTSADTVTVSLYSDAVCTTQIGTGTKATFIGAGITATVSSNATNTIYAKAVDSLGNPSNCTSLTSYVHDNTAPIAPSYVSSSPATPSNGSTTVAIVGTASGDTVTVKTYNDSSCTSEIGSDTRAAFVGAGVSSTMTANATTTVYGKAFDALSNASACTNFVSYVHDNTAPTDPSFVSFTPSSPNNSSTTPSVVGGASADTATIELFSDVGCSVSLASGTRAQWVGAGIGITLTANTTTDIYAKASDSLGNAGNCVAMGTYIHDSDAPAGPGFTSMTPPSPAANAAPVMVGTAPADAVSVTIYSNAGCTVSVGTGTRAAYVGAGLTLSVSQNATTSIYGATLDNAGNYSGCTLLSSYVEDETAPTSPGTPSHATWSNSTTASPSITYTASTDALSGVSEYQYSLGTSAGATGVRGWTTNGTSTSLTASGLTLASGTTYYVNVKAIDAATNTSSVVSSTGWTVDTVLPTTPGAPSMSAYSTSTTARSATWTASTDALSGLQKYEYAIGTTSGGTQTRNWTSTGTTASVSATGLALVSGTTYYMSVRATDNAGNVSGVATTSWIVDNIPPTLDIFAPNDGDAVPGDYSVEGNCELGLTVTVTALNVDTGSSDTFIIDPPTVCSGGNYLITVSDPDSAPGEWIEITATSTDLAGNTSTYVITVKADP